MTSGSFQDILCVYVPREHLTRVTHLLSGFHPGCRVEQLPSGWIVVDVDCDEPSLTRSELGHELCIAFGREHLFPAGPTPSGVAELAERAANTPRELNSIPGDFCFVGLFAGGRAAAVRSCSGVPRLYTFHLDGITAVSTRIEWIARVFPRPLELNVDRLVSDEHALGTAPHHTSVVRGVAIVPVGHVATCGMWTSPRLSRYWWPPTSPLPHAGVADIAEELDHLLRRELRGLDPAGNNVLLFSGGLDSSLLAGLIHHLGVDLDAVTILPPIDHPSLAKERYYTSLLTPWFRQHVVQHLDGAELLARIEGSAGSLCPVVSSEWLALAGLSRAPAAIVTGWFADECFGHLRLPELFRTWIPDPRGWRRVGQWRELSKLWFRRRRAGRSPFQTEGLTVPAWFNRRATPDYEGWLRAETWMPRPECPGERLFLHRKLTDIAGAYAEGGPSLQGRVVAPFASRSVIELAAQCAVRHLYQGGLAKAPLRHLAARYLPPPLSQRTDKGDWGLRERLVARPHVDAALTAVLDTQYLQAHPTLSLDEAGTILWIEALERGRVDIEHDRQTIWPA